MTLFDSVLIANRGEIAVRVIRTLRRLGIRSVAVYSDADAGAPHVRLADEAVRLGPAPAAQSYLDVAAVLRAAQVSGAQAVHPGYGFLSENTAFARACRDAGLVFVGPPPAAIEAMGDKIRAKATVQAAGVPVVPGVHRPGMDDAALTAAADEVGYPLLVKASAGGGGKGMRVVREPAALADALAAARREARSAFGDDALLLERWLERPRHIEVQVLADAHGHVVHLGERECSLQRRHQKVIEEAPSPVLDDATRAAMGRAAVEAARSCGYEGAGTVELIAAGNPRPDDGWFFLEMNTRLQVEHPVTELVWGLDLVEQQLRVAAGQPLAFTQDDLGPSGHAVEARVYAEDPARGFLPTGGRLVVWDEPRGVRVDSGVATGSVITSHYDPMLAKVIAHGATRDEALARLHAGLGELVALGVTTNVAFLRALLEHPDVRAGRLDTGLIERDLDDLLPPATTPEDVLRAVGLASVARRRPKPGRPADPFAAPTGWRPGEAAWTTWRLSAGDHEVDVRVRGTADSSAVEVALGDGEALTAQVEMSGDVLRVALDGTARTYRVVLRSDHAWIGRDGAAWLVRERDRLEAERHGEAVGAGGRLTSPMPGSVAAVHVAEGETVKAGQPLVVVEAMKMEHPLVAPFDGTVAALHVRAGQQVAMDEPLVEVAPVESAA